MIRSQLDRRHAEYDAAQLRALRDLFVGGQEFRRDVADYLPRNDVEPTALYRKRVDRAHYINYCAPIVSYFAAAVFERPFRLVPEGHVGDAEDVALPSAIAAFKEDCDGHGTDFDAFMRARFVDALVYRRGWTRIEFREVDLGLDATLADATRAGAFEVSLSAIDPRSVTNWRKRPGGSFEWVLTTQSVSELRAITDAGPTREDMWTLYDETGLVRSWRIVTPPGEHALPTDVAEELPPSMSRLGRMPLVALDLPCELHVMGLLESPAFELFRKRCGLSWAMDRTCYPMLLHKSVDPKRALTAGAGYVVVIDKDEELDWISPPSTPLDAIGSYAGQLREEMYRVSHQMAQGIENNAAAVGRSGESKAADHDATNTVLSAFGEIVEETAERVVDMVAAGLGDASGYDVSGMDSYDVSGVTEVTDKALAAELLSVPSPTYRRELHRQLVRASLPGASAELLSQIDDEIAGDAVDVTTDADAATTSGGTVPQVEHAKDQQTALNGAQATAMVDIVKAAAAQEIPRESAVALIVASFPVSRDQAEGIVGTAGAGFVSASKTTDASTSASSANGTVQSTTQGHGLEHMGA